MTSGTKSLSFASCSIWGIPTTKRAQCPQGWGDAICAFKWYVWTNWDWVIQDEKDEAENGNSGQVCSAGVIGIHLPDWPVIYRSSLLAWVLDLDCCGEIAKTCLTININLDIPPCRHRWSHQGWPVEIIKDVCSALGATVLGLRTRWCSHQYYQQGKGRTALMMHVNGCLQRWCQQSGLDCYGLGTLFESHCLLKQGGWFRWGLVQTRGFFSPYPHWFCASKEVQCTSIQSQLKDVHILHFFG